MSVRALFPTLDTVVSLSYIQRLISDDDEGESCWMSCLQCHQLTGTHKGVGIDVSKLLVAFKGSEKEGGKERGKKKCVSSFFFCHSSVCKCVSACDSQCLHLCAVEGVTRHLPDAISVEPSVIRKRSQITDMQLQQSPAANLSQQSGIL